MKTCPVQDATISTCFVGVMRQHSCLTPSRGRGVARGAVAHPSPPAHISSSPYRCVSISEQTRGVRERLFKECLSGGLLYLEAGDPILRNGSDVFHPFRADSNFLYVTGVNQPGFGCLLDSEAGASVLDCSCAVGRGYGGVHPHAHGWVRTPIMPHLSSSPTYMALTCASRHIHASGPKACPRGCLLGGRPALAGGAGARVWRGQVGQTPGLDALMMHNYKGRYGAAHLTASSNPRIPRPPMWAQLPLFRGSGSPAQAEQAPKRQDRPHYCRPSPQAAGHPRGAFHCSGPGPGPLGLRSLVITHKRQQQWEQSHRRPPGVHTEPLQSCEDRR